MAANAAMLVTKNTFLHVEEDKPSLLLRRSLTTCLEFLTGDSSDMKQLQSSMSSASTAWSADENEWRTTVMVRHIPNKYTQEMLLAAIDDAGFAGKYNFFYAPVDFKNDVNLGYAFLNLTTTESAQRFLEQFDQSHLQHFNSKKSVVLEFARLQGFQPNVEHLRNSSVMSPTVPATHQPAVFADGQRVAFPKPLPGRKTGPKTYTRRAGN